MLTESARVVAIENGVVWVETLRQSSCGSCAARSGCGHGMLNAAAPGTSRALLKAVLPPDSGLQHRLKLHDRVTIAIPERNFLRYTALLYAMPLFIALAAALLADAYWMSDGLSQGAADLRVTVAAALGLGTGLYALRRLSHRDSANESLLPQVTDIS